MKTILVPIDFSAGTQSVIAEAVALARSSAARLVLLNVISPLPTAGAEFGFPEAAGITADAMHHAHRRLGHVQERLDRVGIAASTVCDPGNPGGTIVARAREVSADYIVIGSHGHGAIYDLIVGSTTSRVLKEATCPVLVVPRGVKAGGQDVPLDLGLEETVEA